MSGIVGVCCSELTRFAEFSNCLANLHRPTDSVVEFRTGMNVALNRKAIVETALEQDVDWVFFVDDDMLFDTSHLERLLTHKLPVVGSLYLNRNPPFYAMAFNDRKVIDGEPGWLPASLKGAPQTGLAEVVAAGTGGLLVKTEVLRAIPSGTWFDHEKGTEDLPFCHRITEAGYKIYVDLEARMGHISTYAVWPNYESGDWRADVALTEKHVLRVEMEAQ